MTAFNVCLISTGMAKRDNAARTAQINFRLKESTIERMEKFRDAHALHPSLTQIVEAAVKGWLDTNERDLPEVAAQQKRSGK